MSHTTTLSGLAINSKPLIEYAVLELQKKGVNVSLIANARPRMYYNSGAQMQHPENSDLVLKIANSRYDVGFDFDKKSNEYNLVYDEWGGYVQNVIGIKLTGKNGDKDWTDEDHQLSHIAKFTREYNLGLLKQDMIERDYDFGIEESERGYLITCENQNIQNVGA